MIIDYLLVAIKIACDLFCWGVLIWVARGLGGKYD